MSLMFVNNLSVFSRVRVNWNFDPIDLQVK